MARIKNVSGEPVELPSLGLLVQPDEIVDVPEADGFKGSDIWQITTTSKSKKERTS